MATSSVAVTAVTNPTYTFTAGDRIDLCIVIDDAQNGGQLDLSTLELRWGMTSGTVSSYDTTPLVEKGSADPTQIEIVDAAGGSITVKIYGADTKDLIGEHYWELEAVDTDDEKIVVARGDFNILANVQNTLIPSSIAR